MTAPEGTLNLVIDMAIEDSGRAEYVIRPGSDLVTILNHKQLRNVGNAVGHIELIDDDSGLLIAGSEPMEFQSGRITEVRTLRIIHVKLWSPK